MGKLVGIFDPSGRGTAAFRRLNHVQGTQRHQQPGLLMACDPDHSFARAAACQPCLLRSPRGNIIAWDGRLDNPGEVQAHNARLVPAPQGGADLALASYEASGAAGLGSLVGDWSAAIWDSDARSLTLASDFAGVRSLYYQASHGVLLWSSSLQNLVEWTSGGELDDDYIAEILARGASIGRTPYRGIRAVPPGKALRFRDGGATIVTFWQLNPGSSLRFRREQDYVDRLQSLFEEAVRVRIPAGSPVCVELSGGLDSSSIACMARKLTAEKRVSPSRLTAVTYTHADSPDEKFARRVEQCCRIESMRLDVEAYPYVAAGLAGNAAPSWWAARNTELAERMTASQVPVLLSGQIGDLVMGNWHDESDRVADLIRQGSLLRAGAQAHAWSKLLHVPIPWILGRAIRLNLPFMRPPSRSVGDLPRDGSDSLSKRTRKRAAEMLDLSAGEARWRDAPNGRRKHFRMLAEILDSRSLEVPEELYPISYTHPYAHRPLVEYMLAIPPEIVCGIGEPRRLMRRAFAGLLPPAVLRRKSKASFSEIFARALRPLAEKVLESPHKTLLATRGYIDAASLGKRLRRFLNGLDCNEPQLRRVILVEFWLRSHIARAEAGSAAAPLAGALTESR